MELLVSENKGRIPSSFNCVRIFIQKDYTYGYFIVERELFDLLTVEQQKTYPDTNYFDITYGQAEKILASGSTPFRKQILYRE